MGSPLSQRLKLYGFALVQTDPRRPIDPNAWGLPTLQAAVKGVRWNAICSQCLPFSWHSKNPVIASSRMVLREVRRRQPGRPLIWCQTAFEKPPKAIHWQKLLCRKPFPFVVKNDPGWPLLWIPPRQNQAQSVVLPYPKQHPVLKRIGLLKKSHPDHHFWLEENGQLAVQFDLFQRFRPSISRWFDDLDRELDDALKNSVWLFKTPHLVVAEKEETLHMFRMDVIRWWGKRFCFLKGIVPRLDETFGRVFVLVTDAELRWAAPGFRGWPVVHLGAEAWQMAYRMLRVSLPHVPSWYCPEPLLGEAFLAREGKQWQFHRSHFGWHGSLVEHALPRLDRALEETAACFGEPRPLNAKSRLS